MVCLRKMEVSQEKIELEMKRFVLDYIYSKTSLAEYN